LVWAAQSLLVIATSRQACTDRAISQVALDHLALSLCLVLLLDIQFLGYRKILRQ
jgi:hypothetical protein